MDSPEVNIPQEEPVKKHNPILRLLGVLGLFTSTALGRAACGNTPSEQQGIQYGQQKVERDAKDTQKAAGSKQAEEIRKQVNQALDQNSKPFAER